MILGLEDITGGATMLALLIWLGFTALFYPALYLTVLNVSDDLTKNSFLKIPLLILLAPMSAFFMAIFNYNPNLLFFIMMISNYFRVRGMDKKDHPRFKDIQVNKPLFYTASYLYIIGVFGLASWFQIPVAMDGMSEPLWQTWFPAEIP